MVYFGISKALFVFFLQGKHRKQEVCLGVIRNAGCSLNCVGEAGKGQAGVGASQVHMS